MDQHDHLTPTDAPADTPRFPCVIDATMRSDWLRCPHSFFRRHVQGLVPSGAAARNIHLHFGACVARGLEVARRTYHATHDAGDALKDACEAAIAEWGDYEPVGALTRSGQNKSLANCLLAIQQYLRDWPLDDDEVQIHEHNGSPCIEFSLCVPIPGTTHPDTGEPIGYAGRFDLIGDYNGRAWGLDDKTTSYDPNNDNWRKQWQLRGQFSGYCWGAREYGINLAGFLVRGIGVLTSSVKTGTAIVSRPQWMVDAWLRQLQDDVLAMCSQYSDLYSPNPFGHAFPQAFDHACADFGGCAYLDLCSSEHPERWLDNYETRFWNPVERVEDVAA